MMMNKIMLIIIIIFWLKRVLALKIITRLFLQQKNVIASSEVRITLAILVDGYEIAGYHQAYILGLW